MDLISTVALDACLAQTAGLLSGLSQFGEDKIPRVFNLPQPIYFAYKKLI